MTGFGRVSKLSLGGCLIRSGLKMLQGGRRSLRGKLYASAYDDYRYSRRLTGCITFAIVIPGINITE
ncbi:hypothetical protein CEP53_014991 [Fusarium sp. AF-6]|nr:hypothetical protein CEP53_014991 [Fusarium sp. AF-6]